MALINTPTDSKDIIEHFEHYKGLISQTRGNLFNSVGYEVTDTIFNKAYFSSKDVLSYEFIEGKISSANAIIKNLEAIKYNIGETSIFNTAQKKLLQEKIQKHILELGIIKVLCGYFERKSSINLNFLRFFNHLWIPIFCFKCQNTASNEFVVVGSCIFSFRNS